MTGLVSIKKAAELLGVSVSTLRRWDQAGKLTALRTAGGDKRRYRLEDIERLQGVIRLSKPKSEAVAIYCRVSSGEQKTKGDLERQKGRVLEYCVNKGYQVEHIFDEVGSGMNDQRPKLHKMIDLAAAGKLSRVVVEHSDRLIRFNKNLLVKFFNTYGVTVEWMEEQLPKTYEAEMVEDMMSLVTSYSSRMYGRRSAERRKKPKLVAVE